VAAPAQMIDPPDGWLPHAFWHDFRLEVAAHQEALAVGALFLLLLVVGRALLPPADRPRLRIALAALIFFFLALPLRVQLLSLGYESTYRGLRLAAVIALLWGIIGVGGLLVFDLVGRRFGVAKILRDLTTTVVSFVAVVVVLSRSGVNFLSIITTSAVLTAVIGLALQDTLSHLISGIALQLESTFSIGDWVRVDERPIGKVQEIRWRSTVIRTKNDDLVVIPNGLVTKGVLTIFAKDGLENRRWVYFNVHARHPPNQVQKVVKEALVGTPNVSTRTPPDCLLWKYADSWIEYAVRYRLVDYQPDDPTDSEVRKRIWYALHRNNIEISYPGHNVFLTQLDAARDQTKSERELHRRIEALDGVSFFAPLSDDERTEIAHALQHRVYGTNEVIIRAGAEAHDLYLLREGDAAVKIGVDGLEKEVATLRAGQFFGEMSLLTGAPRSATVVARTDVDIYVLGRASFKALLDKNPPLLAQVAHLLAEREVKNKIQLDGLSAEAARQHVADQDFLGRIKNFFGFA
jgi:small-conductance mechanosensitive channel/CRP-like cAMP-binding protein